jgi:hypothetical protein
MNKIKSVDVDGTEATIILANGIECYSQVAMTECQCSSGSWDPKDSVDYTIEAPQLTSYIAKNSDGKEFMLTHEQAEEIDMMLKIEADKAYLEAEEERAKEMWAEAKVAMMEEWY